MVELLEGNLHGVHTKSYLKVVQKDGIAFGITYFFDEGITGFIWGNETHFLYQPLKQGFGRPFFAKLSGPLGNDAQTYKAFTKTDSMPPCEPVMEMISYFDYYSASDAYVLRNIHEKKPEIYDLECHVELLQKNYLEPRKEKILSLRPTRLCEEAYFTNSIWPSRYSANTIVEKKRFTSVWELQHKTEPHSIVPSKAVLAHVAVSMGINPSQNVLNQTFICDPILRKRSRKPVQNVYK